MVCDTTTQTEEFDYMFKTAKRRFDREDMLDDDKVVYIGFILKCQCFQNTVTAKSYMG